MGRGFDTSRDFGNDSSAGIRNGADRGSKPGPGGDLARGLGVDLNAGSDFIDRTTLGMTYEQKGEDLNDSGLDAVLDNFQSGKWAEMPQEGRMQSILELADYVAGDTGNENPPEIVFRDDMPDGTYGGYNPGSNKIEININMMDDPSEAADTIAHEMWHAYQEQASRDPGNPRAAEYLDGFENYISPEYDFEGYENQMVEAEARQYAQGFKDRIR